MDIRFMGNSQHDMLHRHTNTNHDVDVGIYIDADMVTRTQVMKTV